MNKEGYIKHKMILFFDYLERYLCHNKILKRTKEHLHVNIELDKRIDKLFLLNRDNAIYIENNKMFFQRIMGRSVFNQYNNALKNLDSLVIILNKKRKRYTEEEDIMIKSESMNEKFDTEIVFPSNLESNIKIESQIYDTANKQRKLKKEMFEIIDDFLKRNPTNNLPKRESNDMTKNSLSLIVGENKKQL